MGRCRLVRPNQVRIYLAEVQKHAQREIEEQLAKEKDSKQIKALTEALVAASDQLAQAERDNDFIDVKRELNTAETRETGRNTKPGEGHTIEEMANFQRARLLAYLLGWSFVDYEGKPLDVSPGALDALEVETFGELVKAIDFHEQRIAKERDDRKKIQGGETSSVQTSPSVAI